MILYIVIFILNALRQEPALSSNDRLDRQIVRLVRSNFFDPKRAAEWAEAHGDYAPRTDNQRDFSVATNRLLSELRTSHSHYYTPADVEYYGLLAIYQEALGIARVECETIGADFTHDHFVKSIFAGGPSERAGLLRGDKILGADGRPFDPVACFQGHAGQVVTLAVQRTAGGSPIEVRVTPHKVNPKQEWLDAQRRGTRVILHRGKRIAYAPLFSCGGDEHLQALREAIVDSLHQADALILDFRDGWGGCNPDFLNLFNSAPPALTLVGRDGQRQTTDSQWRKPVYLLINGGSRSGKEVVAYAIKTQKIGTLIGERTAGAVVAGRPFLLSDRSLLYLAVADVLLDGQRLEGVGVEPDVVLSDRLAYAAGSDIQLDRALAIASGEKPLSVR